MVRQSSLFVFIAILFTSIAHANVVGADTQNFNPTTNGLDFVTVHSSETLRPGVFNTGLFWNYAVNSLPNLSDVSNQSLSDVRDGLTSMDFHIGVGLMKNWDAGISFPYLVHQSVDNPAPNAQFSQTGMTEIKVNTKYRFFGDEHGGLAAILSINAPMIENNPFTGDGAGPTINIELAADTTVSQWALGGNIGYRARSPGDVIPAYGIEPFGDQLLASVAVSRLIPGYDIKFIGEVFGSYHIDNTQFPSDRTLSSLEFLTGLKWDARTDLAAHFGVGAGLLHGTASPDFRVYTGVNYTFGPLFAKKESYTPITYDEPVSSYHNMDGNENVFDRVPTAPVETFVTRDILFEFNKHEVRRDFFPVLAKLAVYLEKGPGVTQLIIEGHTDSIGSAEYNLELSRKRAESVRSLLLEVTKLDPKKIIAVGKGESEPIGDNGNYQGRQLNRRVEFKIHRRM